MTAKKILIVDDEEDFKIIMKSVFEQHGYEVITAENFSDGLQMLELHRPNLLFLDNKLPDGFGWGNLDYIQTHFPDTQVTLISAYDVPKTSSSSFQILEKPITLADLNSIFASEEIGRSF
jgi:DNA-binding NtrC family response regulator